MNQAIGLVGQVHLNQIFEKMTITEQKLTIVEQVLQVEDESLLNSLKSLFDFGLKRQKQPAADFWKDLPEAVRARLELAIRQLEADEGIPHEAVMDAFRKKYRP